MTAWNGEEDGYVTNNKDTWAAEPRQKQKSRHPMEYLKGLDLKSEGFVRGAVEALRYAGCKVNCKCYPTNVGDELIEEANAIQAEWERRQHEEISR